MYLFLITVLLAFLVISLSLWLASFRHEPKFHNTERDFAWVMSLVLSGQADYDQWSSVMHIPIRHDLRLEAVLLGALSEGNAAKEALAQKIEQAIQDVEDLITMYEAS